MTAPTFPADVLSRLVASDPGRPRLTWYDDAPGSTQGERVELSARVIVNWVSKAANLLQDDCAAGPGTTVGLDLPPHWRAIYWACATWSVGGTVVVGADVSGSDVLVTTSPERAAGHGGDAVLVSLPALARSHPHADDAAEAVDEARELSTHGDRFTPLADPEPGDVALSVDGHDTTYADLLVPEPGWAEGVRIAVDSDLAPLLHTCLAAWVVDGSVVAMRGSAGVAPEILERRLSSEAATPL